jgi:hypothetical protein
MGVRKQAFGSEVRVMKKDTESLLCGDPPVVCDHGIKFDPAEAADLPADEVRKRFPRLDGPCPKGCGYVGIAYVSWLHMIAGDW